MSTTSAFILTLYPYNFKLMKNFSRVRLFPDLGLYSFFFDDVPQYLVVQRQVRVHLFQLPVLLFKLF